jgi:hypothetical protein
VAAARPAFPVRAAGSCLAVAVSHSGLLLSS